MQKIFNDTRLLDKAARDNYGLTEDIMMENAAAALQEQGRAHFFSPDGKYINRPTVLILAGGGNNGADGYALARRIVCHDLCVTVCQVYQPKSAMCVTQAERAKKAGVIFINPYDLDDFIERASFDLTVVYDCIFGSGFHGTLDALAAAVIQSANKIDGAYKIACDIPTGVSNGDCSQDQKAAAFVADETVTMGALKLALYTDAAKDACGQIVVADLGISRSNFESAASTVCAPTNDFGITQDSSQAQDCAVPCALLLEEADARLPLRDKKQNSNKGTYGHTAVFAGTKPGAAVIAGHAALKFGSGLVTLVAQAAQKIQFGNVSDFELMVSETVPQNATALVVGPGLGRATDSAVFDILRNTERPLVLDADIFYWPQIKELLAAKKNVVLTPHPKEFAELLKNVGLGNYSTQQVVAGRLELAKEFCAAFPGATLLLKGANILIASLLDGERAPRVYINPLGTSALAKGGSGDVLAGMTGALLAQGYTPLEAAVTASIKHASASHAFDGKDYALTPFELIREI
ncbi:MAG: NAD(P)H-hydrate dehydratase [Treponema sp.]|nr:NAD(P)H-hydrate dehydratase [Treponema sp.]